MFLFIANMSGNAIDKALSSRASGQMERKSHIDAFGAIALSAFALNLAFNQVVIKVTNGGFNPVFSAGLRSLGAIVVLVIWMKLRGVSFAFPRAAWGAAVLSGILFTFEFTCLFIALDTTTVSRASVIFYSMPVWLTIAVNFLLPDERLTKTKIVGLVLAMLGIAVALGNRSGGHVSWLGDLLALMAALSWAGIALLVRVTPLEKVPPAQQLMCQVAISGLPVLAFWRGFG